MKYDRWREDLMNFDDVIKNIANQTSVKRSANIGKDFRGQVSKEGVLAQKKIFLDDKKVIERFSIYDSNYDMRRFIVCVFLNKENYSINDNLKLIEKEIELFRKQLIEYGKFIQWNEKEREIYETVLDAVLEDNPFHSAVEPLINLNFRCFWSIFTSPLAEPIHNISELSSCRAKIFENRNNSNSSFFNSAS